MILELSLFLLIQCTKNFALEIIELDHDLAADSIWSPILNVEPFNLEVIQTGYSPLPDGNVTRYFWVASNRFCTVEHIGTHIDAPYNYYEHGWTVDKIPIERFFAPVSVIDIRTQAANNTLYELSTDDVENWIRENGMFPNNSIILIMAGWSKRYPNKTLYAGHESDVFQYKFPGLSLKAVQAIFELQKTHGIHIVAFGLDFLSVHSVPIDRYKVHEEICKRNVYIIENMNNLESLPAKGARIMVMPMKIRGGTGSPARVVARRPYPGEKMI